MSIVINTVAPGSSHGEAPITNDVLKQDMITDTIAAGLSFMLLTNVLQRGIGFLRNIAFCHFLSQQDLGIWALASGFFVLAAPLSVLGLPGSIGRFTEFYRTRNQLTGYLRWMVLGSSTGVLVFSALLLANPTWSSEYILGDKQSRGTVFLLTATLLTVVVFNFMTELLSGLRQNRVVSRMQMVNSLSFTALSVAWLMFSSDWRGVLLAFAIASVLGMIPGLHGLRTTCRVAFINQAPIQTQRMWLRVIPFAASVWLMNLLGNLFDVVDRYMLLYLASSDSMTGTAIVGQYHSGRILPVLITSLSMMLNGMILPHLCADWEAGKFEAVRTRVRSTLKLLTLFFWALSIGGMVVAPILFQSLLDGRYAEGLSIMPLGLIHCTYSALAAFLFSYFLCEEKGNLVTKLMAGGLILNISLNYAMVPRWSVFGAMLATSIAGVVILAMTIGILYRRGFKIGFPALILCILPASLALSTSLSMCLFAATLVTISRSNLLLDPEEKDSLNEHINPVLKRLGLSGSESCFWR